MTDMEIILTKVEELDALISQHAKNRHSRDKMSHKLYAIRRTAENALAETGNGEKRLADCESMSNDELVAEIKERLNQ
jgi:hypothetical protein